jgi:sugar phosphate isomerase/epimerase
VGGPSSASDISTDGWRIGLSMYGTPYSMGLSPASDRAAFTAYDLIEQATTFGLAGIELPAALLTERPEDIGEHARARNLFITVDTGGVDPEALAQVFEIAARAGSPTVRTVVGGAKLGGDRRAMAGRWQPFLADVLVNLTTATKAAEQAGVTLAVENHQDLASEELLMLCETIASPNFGITLDTGNPLGTGEEPIDYFRRVAPHVKNVHLKDYRVFAADAGYRLARCALGQGVIDFPALLGILASAAPDVSMAIELGAHEARYVRVLADDFWPEYPARSARQLAATVRFVQAEARSTGDWRTPFERAESVESIVAYEQRELIASVAYVDALKSISWSTTQAAISAPSLRDPSRTTPSTSIPPTSGPSSSATCSRRCSPASTRRYTCVNAVPAESSTSAR